MWQLRVVAFAPHRQLHRRNGVATDRAEESFVPEDFELPAFDEVCEGHTAQLGPSRQYLECEDGSRVEVVPGRASRGRILSQAVRP